jgi:hypothetical protein
MARDIRDLGDLARGIRQAYLAVNAAIPLPAEPVAGVVAEQATPAEEHLMTLREIAFEVALGGLLDCEYYADPADLAALGQGVLPSARED